MENVNKFGERLLKLREERKETQQQLADAIGITRQSLSRYETNERTPNIDLVYNIAKHYNVSADYLLGLSEIQMSELAIKKIQGGENDVKMMSESQKSQRIIVEVFVDKTKAIADLDEIEKRIAFIQEKANQLFDDTNPIITRHKDEHKIVYFIN